MSTEFTYISKPSAYIIQTSKQAYMVVEGKKKNSNWLSSRSQRKVGQIRSTQKHHYERPRKCKKHRSPLRSLCSHSRVDQKGKQRNAHSHEKGRKVTFEEYGMHVNCNYNNQLQDENQCLRTQNKCLQQYIKVLEQRCNGSKKLQKRKSMMNETDKNQLISRQGSCMDKFLSTKGTASWISYQN